MVSLATWICGRKDTTLEENRIFADLPERVNNLSTFSTLIKTRIGMLVVYTPSDISYFENMIHELRSHEYMMDILVR